MSRLFQGPCRNIATFCSYIPDEILYAGGFIPFRMRGDGQPSGKSRAFFPTYMCSYTMNCLDVLLNQRVEVSGLVFANSCHAMETLYETARELVVDMPTFMISVPRISSDLAVHYFCAELERFRAAIEETYEVEVSDERLVSAIRLYNRKRDLRNQIEQLIIQKKLTLSAAEIEDLGSKSVGAADDFIQYASAIIARTDAKLLDASRGPRIMIAGCVYAPLDIARVVEQYGGTPVICYHCDGFRNMLPKVNESIAPIQALAEAYLRRPACARDCDLEKRSSEFIDLIGEYGIEAVIFSALKFCPDQGYGILPLIDLLRGKHIPFLVVDVEYAHSSSGQIHTRIQAFLECL